MLSAAQAAIRERFARAVARPADEVDLARAALLMAAEEYEGLDVEGQVTRFEALAGEARAQMGGVPLAESDEFIRRFNEFFFGGSGFRGNEADYADPRNSFLNEVLDRRTGIPISLAAVYLEVARRLGAPVHGVGFPGHFLVKWEWPESGEEVLVDPFAGRILDLPACHELLARVSRGTIPFRSEMLAIVGAPEILSRMLRNLKALWIQREDFLRAVSATDRLLLLEPDSSPELRDRGLLWLRLECYRAALVDLEGYLAAAPFAHDATAVAEQLVALRQIAARIS